MLERDESGKIVREKPDDNAHSKDKEVCVYASVCVCVCVCVMWCVCMLVHCVCTHVYYLYRMKVRAVPVD